MNNSKYQLISFLNKKVIIFGIFYSCIIKKYILIFKINLKTKDFLKKYFNLQRIIIINIYFDSFREC